MSPHRPSRHVCSQPWLSCEFVCLFVCFFGGACVARVFRSRVYRTETRVLGTYLRWNYCVWSWNFCQNWREMGLKMPNFSNGRRITDAGCKMWVSGAAEEPDKRGPSKRHMIPVYFWHMSIPAPKPAPPPSRAMKLNDLFPCYFCVFHFMIEILHPRPPHPSVNHVWDGDYPTRSAPILLSYYGQCTWPGPGTSLCTMSTATRRSQVGPRPCLIRLYNGIWTDHLSVNRTWTDDNGIWTVDLYGFWTSNGIWMPTFWCRASRRIWMPCNGFWTST